MEKPTLSKLFNWIREEHASIHISTSKTFIVFVQELRFSVIDNLTKNTFKVSQLSASLQIQSQILQSKSKHHRSKQSKPILHICMKECHQFNFFPITISIPLGLWTHFTLTSESWFKKKKKQFRFVLISYNIVCTDGENSKLLGIICYCPRQGEYDMTSTSHQPTYSFTPSSQQSPTIAMVSEVSLRQ
jgi:hypothetical protein